MGRTTSGKLRNILGLIKDKASQSKAALLSNPTTLSFHLSLLRATTHDPFTPPLHKHLSAILSFGHSSRATASSAIEALMDRLQTTRDSSVALKCLFIVHLVLVRGDFILQDQLSVYPSTGGRNYLKLSNFRDNSSPLSWELSSWVRWYVEGNKLVEDIMGFVCEDHFSAINEVSVRVGEFRERLGGLSFGESVELVCALTRLENCKGRLYELSARKRSVMESFWCLIGEIKEGVGMEKDGGKLMIRVRSEKAGESARYGERVLRSGDSVRFSSGRFPFHVPESMESYQTQ
ncbi:putative clathrin assembly protein At4g40080 isoform X2 [Juglans microcarpa x Juglans regia]|uniref:putative clathrin assembly protein At4g40080 isoform X2 n=1 Tax=Juglans microcarpa x Juglans regia TaxID=2249226 RepID=UPI001B7E3669|nr:putative clathrin assembly protein At4g40080 isoform X2 [Juglans microcarpa x Juglans regia]